MRVTTCNENGPSCSKAHSDTSDRIERTVAGTTGEADRELSLSRQIQHPLECEDGIDTRLWNLRTRHDSGSEDGTLPGHKSTKTDGPNTSSNDGSSGSVSIAVDWDSLLGRLTVVL